MDIKTGELNKRISIVSVVPTIGDNGFETDQTPVYCNCWAKITNMSGSQMFKAGALYDKSITRFVVRYRRDKIITSDLKIKYKNTLYNILSVNNYNEDNEFIEIMGEVVLNG